MLLLFGENVSLVINGAVAYGHPLHNEREEKKKKTKTRERGREKAKKQIIDRNK